MTNPSEIVTETPAQCEEETQRNVATEEQAEKVVEEMKKTAAAFFRREAQGGKLCIQSLKDFIDSMDVVVQMKDIVQYLDKTMEQATTEVAIDETQFLKMILPSIETENLFRAYASNTNGSGFMDYMDLWIALAELGIYGFNQLQASKLVRNFTKDRGIMFERVSFHLFSKICTPFCLQLGRERTPQDKEVSDFEIVGYIHAIFGATVLALFSFMPKPATYLDSSKTTNNTKTSPRFPLVYDPNKDLFNLTDVLTLLGVFLWGGFFILYLKTKGTYVGRIFCLSSLGAAAFVIIILLLLLNPVLCGIFAICLLLFGIGFLFVENNNNINKRK